MFEVMRRGWDREELERFVEATKSAHKDSPFDLEIYRGALVAELYGTLRSRRWIGRLNPPTIHSQK